jgi:hypothetical protein
MIAHIVPASAANTERTAGINYLAVIIRRIGIKIDLTNVILSAVRPIRTIDPTAADIYITGSKGLVQKLTILGIGGLIPAHKTFETLMIRYPVVIIVNTRIINIYPDHIAGITGRFSLEPLLGHYGEIPKINKAIYGQVGRRTFSKNKTG